MNAQRYFIGRINYPECNVILCSIYCYCKMFSITSNIPAPNRTSFPGPTTLLCGHFACKLAVGKSIIQHPPGPDRRPSVTPALIYGLPRILAVQLSYTCQQLIGCRMVYKVALGAKENERESAKAIFCAVLRDL